MQQRKEEAEEKAIVENHTILCMLGADKYKIWKINQRHEKRHHTQEEPIPKGSQRSLPPVTREHT